MSYLPSSRLYYREADPKPEPKPKASASRPAPKPTAVAPPPEPAPMPMPVTLPSLPPPPKLIPPVAPQSKEWLVASAPLLNIETSAPKIETVTTPAAPFERTPFEKKPGRTRDMFNRAQKVVLKQFDRTKKNSPEPSEPDLLWFAVMVTGSLCMGLMIWGAYSALPRFGMVRTPLRAGGLDRKLKVSSDVPVRWVHESSPAPHVPYQVPPLVPPMPPAPTIPVSAPPPQHEPPFPEFHAPVEAPLAPLPERKEPVIFVHANLGDTPMTRTWKKLSEASLLVAALTVASSNNLLAQLPQQPQQPQQPSVDSQAIANLVKAVEGLTTQVNALKIEEKLNAVKSELNDKISRIKLDAPKGDSAEFLLLAQRMEMLEKQIANLARQPIAAAPAPAPVGPLANGNLEDIKSKLGSIEQAILKLQPTEKRIALAPPSPEPAVVVKSGNANVIFVNLYNQDLLLLVNKKEHRAPAGMTLTLDNIVPGPATIEVRSPDGIFHKSNPTLVANETFTLTAR